MTGKAAIIGGGVIGGGWAARFLLNGWDVAIFDPDPQAERKIGEVLENARRSLPALADVEMPAEGQLFFHAGIESAVSDADWIQESVPEILETKHRVLAEIQRHCRPGALVGSSTSGFKPSQLQFEAARPEQIFVAHPFNPVYLLPVVELVGHPETISHAGTLLTALGMKPLAIRKEIDAHVADRLLEAVWREALWLVNDNIATTEEIDDVIRFGFGLRWAQMGLFETYRIAGGEAGMRHFIEQFGPCLAWPWTKLTDVPELTNELVEKISIQSDSQSGNHTIRELERIRDDNLVAIMRALKLRGWGAGALLRDHDRRMALPDPADISKPIPTVSRVVPVDWTDYNGHMNEGRYGQVFSDAADAIMVIVGADEDYVKSGKSYFTVENTIRFVDEIRAGETIRATTQVRLAEGKKLRLYHQLLRRDGGLLATCDQLLIHVDLKTRRSTTPAPNFLQRLAEVHEAQSKLPLPEGM